MAKTKRTSKSSKSPNVSKFILNCQHSKMTENDWRIDNAEEVGILAAAAIPASKDLRAPWWTIGDQGSTGSCVGWGTADSVLRWHFTKAGRLLSSQMLSPRYVWMASKETDAYNTRPTTFIESDGTSLKAALDIARKFGVVMETVLPFGTGKLYPGAVNTFYALASQRRIASYFNLGTVLSEWRKWLANNGPILVRLDVDATWDNATATGGHLGVYQPNTTRGGHAVALVGYTPTYFIVRNSWGTGWGDKGFAYASDGYALAAFTESYGVTL
jgi:C1A family cysteine protease